MVRRCGYCKEPGHNRKTCPAARLPNDGGDNTPVQTSAAPTPIPPEPSASVPPATVTAIANPPPVQPVQPVQQVYTMYPGLIPGQHLPPVGAGGLVIPSAPTPQPMLPLLAPHPPAPTQYAAAPSIPYAAPMAGVPGQGIKRTMPELPAPGAGAIVVASETSVSEPTKKKKKEKEPKPPKEHRMRPWRKSASSETRARIDRALHQRMYLVDRTKKGPHEEDFAILGSTGNVYTVKVGELLTCDCPDFQRRNNCCKHVLFVMLKVLRLPSTSPFVYQVALLPSELEKIFREAPPDPRDVVANQQVRTAYKAMHGEEVEGEQQEKEPPARPIEGDCPICYEEMKPSGEAVVTCATCKNHIHKSCFAQWERNARRNITCVLCRSAWVKPVASGGAGGTVSVSKDGYTNMASLQGMSTRRDESTYSSYYRHGGGYAGGYRRRGYGFYW